MSHSDLLRIPAWSSNRWPRWPRAENSPEQCWPCALYSPKARQCWSSTRSMRELVARRRSLWGVRSRHSGPTIRCSSLPISHRSRVGPMLMWLLTRLQPIRQRRRKSLWSMARNESPNSLECFRERRNRQRPSSTLVSCSKAHNPESLISSGLTSPSNAHRGTQNGATMQSRRVN